MREDENQQNDNYSNSSSPMQDEDEYGELVNDQFED